MPAKEEKEKGFERFQIIDYGKLKTGIKLGEGGFGIVYQGKWGRTEVAIKQLKEKPGSEEEFKNETAAWGQLNHPRIVRLFGITLNPYCMVMNYHPQGSLKNLLDNQKEVLGWDADWAIRQQLAEDTANALDYLHREKRMIHRDIKTDNILIGSENGFLRAYLSDFGLTQTHSSSSASQTAGGVAGTIIWMAPELFQGEPCGRRSDIYAYGLVLWTLATLIAHPFRDVPRVTLGDFFNFGEFLKTVNLSAFLQTPENTPKLIKQLLNACVSKDAGQRPPIERVMQDLTGELTTVKGLSSSSVSYKPSMASAAHFSVEGLAATNPLRIHPPLSSVEKKSVSVQSDSSGDSGSDGRRKQVTWAAVKVTNQIKIDASQEDRMEEKLIQLFISSDHFEDIVALKKDEASLKNWVKSIADNVNEYKRILLKSDDCDQEIHDAIAAWFKARIDAQRKAKETQLKQEAEQVRLRKQQEEERRKMQSEKAKREEEVRARAEQERIKGSWKSKIDPKTNKIFYHNSITNQQAWTVPEGYKPEGAALAHQEEAHRAAYEMDRQKKAAEVAIREAKESKEAEILLNHVAQGEQEQAEALLKRNPRLALRKGTVTDLSRRKFTDITAFQYALWALDWRMWKMVLKYMPFEVAAIQFQELEDKGTAYDKHFSLTSLIEALHAYARDFQKWCNEQAWGKVAAHWGGQVGQAQLLLPAHVAQEYCNPKRAFGTCPSFKEEARSESLATNVGEWYVGECSGLRLGEEFGLGYVRGELEQVWGKHNIPNTNGMAIQDATALEYLFKIRQHQLEELRSELRKHTTLSLSTAYR